MTKRSRALGWAALAAVAALVASCGSTVPLAQQQTAGGGVGGSASTAVDPSGGSLPVGSPPGLGTGTGGNITGGGAGSAGGGTGPGRAPTAPGAAPQNAPGSSAVAVNSPVRVGVLYTQGADQAAKTFGVSGLTTGDTKAQAAAVISWINAHGGMGGHRVDPVYYGMDFATAANNPDQAHQTACASLTQDSKVRFVVTILNFAPVTLPCYAKARVGILSDASGLGSETTTKYATFFGAPGDFAIERVVKNLVDSLWARGWLTKSSKVGSLTLDNSAGASVVKQLSQALAGHGLTITSDQRVGEGTGTASQAPNVAFQYRARGVDRIIPLLTSPLFVMNAASSQNYHPAYALSSSFGPAFLEGSAPKDQLKNAAGIGWQPALDIGAGTKPGPVSANETLCYRLMAGAGQASTSATVRGFELQICTLLFYLKSAGERLPALPGDLLSRSRPLIGTSFAPADTFRSDVTRRPDGAAAYRNFTFDDRCSCFQYTSPITTAS